MARHASRRVRTAIFRAPEEGSRSRVVWQFIDMCHARAVFLQPLGRSLRRGSMWEKLSCSSQPSGCSPCGPLVGTLRLRGALLRAPCLCSTVHQRCVAMQPHHDSSRNGGKPGPRCGVFFDANRRPVSQYAVEAKFFIEIDPRKQARLQQCPALELALLASFAAFQEKIHEPADLLANT